MSSLKKLPKRADVRTADAWDLQSLFSGDDAWEAAFRKFEKKISGSTRSIADDLEKPPLSLAACLKFDSELDRRERLGTYAFLKKRRGSRADSVYQRMVGRYQNVATCAVGSGQLRAARDPGAARAETGKAAAPPKSCSRTACCSTGCCDHRPHTLERAGREPAGDAGGDGVRCEPGLSPTAGHRSEVWIGRRTRRASVSS